jgi:hypothetical protein
MKKFLFLILLLFVFAGTHVNAQVPPVYDSFESYTTTLLHGQGGWSANNANADILVKNILDKARTGNQSIHFLKLTQFGTGSASYPMEYHTDDFWYGGIWFYSEVPYATDNSNFFRLEWSVREDITNYEGSGVYIFRGNNDSHKVQNFLGTHVYGTILNNQWNFIAFKVHKIQSSNAKIFVKLNNGIWVESADKMNLSTCDITNYCYISSIGFQFGSVASEKIYVDDFATDLAYLNFETSDTIKILEPCTTRCFVVASSSYEFKISVDTDSNTIYDTMEFQLIPLSDFEDDRQTIQWKETFTPGYHEFDLTLPFIGLPDSDPVGTYLIQAALTDSDTQESTFWASVDGRPVDYFTIDFATSTLNRVVEGIFDGTPWQANNCDQRSWNPFTGAKCALIWAFYPSQSITQGFFDQFTRILTIVPIGYVSHIFIDVENSATSTSTDPLTFDFELMGLIDVPNVNLFSPAIAFANENQTFNHINTVFNIIVYSFFGIWLLMYGLTRKL